MSANERVRATASKLGGVRLRPLLVACSLSLLLGGCHHRQVAPTLPAVVPAPVQQPPTPAAPSMEGPPPESITTAPAVKVTEAKPKRRSKKGAAKATAAPPVEVAAVAPPALQASPVGELSTGGESTPKLQQEATELIASGDRRLEVLAKKAEQAQVREVRRFLQQAREALGTGDAEGARTLATKAKLLMDDLEKAGQE